MLILPSELQKAEIHAKVNWITCYSATLNFPRSMITIKTYLPIYAFILLDCFSENVLILSILISLRAILKSCIIISIAKYWKIPQGYECQQRHQTWLCQTECRFHEFLSEAALLRVNRREQTRVLQLKMLLYFSCLQNACRPSALYTLDWEKILICIKANTMIYRAITKI